MASHAQNEGNLFDLFASELVSHLRALSNHTDARHTNSAVELVQLLACQFQAFQEFQAGQLSSLGPEASAPNSNTSAPASPRDAQCPATEEPSEESRDENSDSCSEFEEDENSNEGEDSDGSAEFEREENSDGQPEEVRPFVVKRKSRSGEALPLTPSVLSPLFSLLLDEAAEELGISRTSLKKALRFFKIRRWPGRKVRGLESTIAQIDGKLAGQGATSKEVDGMKSELTKLQQELNELRHGTLAQIRKNMRTPAAVITRNAYRRLYYSNTKKRTRGLVEINMSSQPTGTSELAFPPAGENSLEADVNGAAKAEQNDHAVSTDGRPANQPSEPASTANKESSRPGTRTFIRPRPRGTTQNSLRLGSRDPEMKASDLEGVLPGVDDNAAGREVRQSAAVLHAENDDHEMLPPKKKIREEGAGDGKGAQEDEGATDGAIRSAKLPKTEPLDGAPCSKCGKRRS